MLALGPRLNGLLAHATEFLEDELFGFISFEGIAGSVVNDVEQGVKFSLQFGVALETSKELRSVGRGHNEPPAREE